MVIRLLSSRKYRGKNSFHEDFTKDTIEEVIKGIEEIPAWFVIRYNDVKPDLTPIGSS